MKKLFLPCLFMLVFAAPQLVLGQVNTDLRPAVKSPEVNKFEQYMNMPVNLVSGTPQVSIPIYTLNYGGMSLPISLEYDASGVKVESIASCVGQNWTLNVGGVVSRIVKGAPDEGSLHSDKSLGDLLTNGYYKDFGFKKLNPYLNNLPAPDYINGNSISSRFSAFSKWLNDAFNGYQDTQPDLYYFSTPDGGCKFTFNDNREIVYLENSDFIIKETSNSYGSEFVSWAAIAPTGIKYDFGINGLNEKSVTSNRGEQLFTYQTDAWFLNKIINLSTNQYINIEYIDNSYSHVFNKKPSKLTPPCVPILSAGAQCSDTYNGGYANFALNPYSDTSTQPAIFSGGGGSDLENNVQSKLISSIKADNIEINFKYLIRDDLYKNDITRELPKRLDEIQVLQNGLCIKKFVLRYSTTVADNFTSGMEAEKAEPIKKRLVLNSFEEISCDDKIKKIFKFQYNTLPLPNKMSYAQDKWGYYNGKLSNITLVPKAKLNGVEISCGSCADKDANINYAIAGALEKIIYPTGGSVEFKFEPHTTNNEVVGGLRIKTITHKDYDSKIVKNVNYQYSSPKITSNPLPIYKIEYDYLDILGSFMSYPSILSQGNIEYFGRWIIKANTNYLSGSHLFLSSGTDPLDINFIGPAITYGSVLETDENGSTTHNFYQYKNYFELNGYSYSKQIPAIPKFQSILSGQKISSQVINKNGEIVKNSILDYNYSKKYVTVYGITMVRNEFGPIYYPYTLEGQTKTLLSETETSKLNGQELSTTKIYEYKGKGHYMPTKTTVSTSNGTSIVTKTAYPQDLSTEPLMANLIAQNRKVPIKQESFKTITNDTVKIAEQKTVFAQDASTSNLLLPKFVYAAKFPNTLPLITNVGNLERKVTSDSYDSSGNLTQFTPENGVPVSIIWGYNKTQPIAKLENMAYGTIPVATIADLQAKSDADTDDCSTATCKEEILRTALNALQSSFLLAQITTYTYNPLIGVTSITDPKGDKQTYTYDGLGRLLYVKDKDGKILSQNQYNYKRNINAAISKTFTKTDCPTGGTPSGSYTYTVPAGKYPADKQAAADLLAQNDINLNGQNIANANLPCSYTNTLAIRYFTKNNCSVGTTPDGFTYTVPAGKYSSTISQAAADQLAQDDINANGQNIANSSLSCKYYNTVAVKAFSKNNCPAGSSASDYKYTYTVPAGKYSSALSQAAADQLAQDDINANGQNVTNANAPCYYFNAIAMKYFVKNNCPAGASAGGFTYTVPAGKYSSTVSQAAADQLAQNDINANGQNIANSSLTCTYFNVAKVGYFSRNNCPAGYRGGGYTYTVPAGRYSSTVSQPAADQLAQNDINANGQRAANNYASCIYRDPREPSCFIAGTKISMADGTNKAIETVKVGEKVWTYDTAKQRIVTGVVEEVTVTIHNELINISFDNNSGNTNTLDHPYYVKGKGWCSFNPEKTKSNYGLTAATLEVGDVVLSLKTDNSLQETKVTNISIINKKQNTYNLHKVSENHNYFANGILVHNKSRQ
jgi:YD repeat-containing protein